MNRKIISLLLLAIMFLSPFAFASDVRLVKVSDLQSGDVIVDEDGNEFEVDVVGNYDDGRVGITGMVVGGLGKITGMAEILTAQQQATLDLGGGPRSEQGAIDFLSKYKSGTGGEGLSAGAGVSSTISPVIAKPDSTFLSNLVGTGYTKSTHMYAGKYYTTEAGAKAARAAAGGEGGITAVKPWQVAGSGYDALLSGVNWAAYAYIAGQMVGPMIGLNKKNTKAFSTAMAAGFGVGKGVSVYASSAGKAWFSSTGWIGAHPVIAGAVIGAVVFLSMYKETETKVVTFDCMPWQAPVGGNVCEDCNDEDLPCSEYRCKSLGQNCELVNAGTADEKCVNVNPRDVNPPTIRPNYEKLSKGYKYTNVKNSPPGPGFKIVNVDSADGCLKAFTPLEFGINVDEPAQCKIDFNHTESFDEMIAFIGGKNLYSYNHTEIFSLPSVAAMKNVSMVLENGKDLTFFIRCKDKNGNENGAEYAVNFCIDPTPDNTAPKIEATSVLNGGCVAENQDKAEVTFYVNEPANCRWSSQDQDYDLMQNTMRCSNEMYQANAIQLFGCLAELTGISRDDTKFYVRCKDQPGADESDRNENKESFEFILRGSTGLKMKDLQPNGTIFGAVSPMPIELKVKTLFGCNEGQAICEYSATGNSGNYIRFFDTNTEDGIHTQRLDLIAGEHKYFVRCIDEGGNLVEDSVTFELDIDTSAPVVARVYEEDGMLKIVTVRDSECAYTFDDCDFTFSEGTEMPYSNSTVHVAEWNEKKTYYIKCRDEFRNEDADCSIVVRPSRNFL